MVHSTGPKRGTTSPILTVFTLDPKQILAENKKNVAAAKKAIDQQQKTAKAASLQQNIQNLQTQISGPHGYRNDYNNNQTHYAYDKSMLAANKWGIDTYYNSVIEGNYLRSGGIQSASVPANGVTLTTADVAAINQDLVDVTAQLANTLSKISQVNTLIDADTKNLGSYTNSKNTNVFTGTTTPTSNKKTDNLSPVNGAFYPPPLHPDSSYIWNLPPHEWSLPVDPAFVNAGVSPTRQPGFHASRRGRLWSYMDYTSPVDQPGYTNTNGVGSITTPPGIVNHTGFQFIWNPETYSQSTAVNMQVTPSVTDPTAGLSGFTMANSQISFTLRIDRTNDFACAGSNNYLISNNIYPTTTDSIDKHISVDYWEFCKFYVAGGSLSSPSVVETAKKIKDLITYGTEADIEYLYRVINGNGWKGISRTTSNIGFLKPSIIRVDLGEQNFAGMVSSVSVTHLAFTRDMVPIRSDVSITIDLRANIMAVTNNTGSKAKHK